MRGSKTGDVPPECRMCGTGQMADLGPLPNMARFAGAIVEPPLTGGRLFRCRACASMQRDPILPQDSYARLYARGTEGVWSADVCRPDHERIAAFIATSGRANSVLDVGCNTGRFLARLPDDVAKYGLEPSRAAATAARESGVTILGNDLASMETNLRFDYITLIDVIEHLPDPAAEIAKALSFLAPGGRLLISTGDPECDSWKNRYRNKFWYCSFAEHIVFPSRAAISAIAARTGHHIDYEERFRYGDFGLLRTAVKTCLQTGYLKFPLLSYAAGWALLRERRNPFSRYNLFLPCAGVYRDHHLISIRYQDSVN